MLEILLIVSMVAIALFARKKFPNWIQIMFFIASTILLLTGTSQFIESKLLQSGLSVLCGLVMAFGGVQIKLKRNN